MDSYLAGAKLLRIEYGLTADIPIDHPLTMPYYVKLEFVRGLTVYPEFYQGSTQNTTVNLTCLGKILERKFPDETGKKMLYLFTDGTILPVGN